MWGALRGGRQLPAVPRRGLAKAAGPRSVRHLREADEAAPVFQYAGKAAKRKDRVFVWGFCYSGALGVPSFVRPDAGWKKPRRIQPTPYRLETEEKVGAGVAALLCRDRGTIPGLLEQGRASQPRRASPGSEASGGRT